MPASWSTSGWPRFRNRAKPLQLIQHGVEPLALDELHDVVRRLFLLAHAEDRHDVGVVQLGRGPGFALEPASLLGVSKRLRGQDLERHVAAQRDLLGLVDDAHSAPAHLAKDAVVAQLLQVGDRDGPVASASIVSSARAMFSIIAIAGKTSRISAAKSGWRSMYSLSGRPLPRAIAVEEFLGQLQHQARTAIPNQTSPSRSSARSGND